MAQNHYRKQGVAGLPSGLVAVQAGLFMEQGDVAA
jgi:hypothetical protein